jgi:PA14 domain
MTKPERSTTVVDAAAAELRSAYTLVADPQCDPVTAMPHLLRAWQAVAWLSRHEVPTEAGSDLGAWLSAEHLALVPDKHRSAVHGTLVAICRHSRDPEPWADPDPAPAVPDATRVLVPHLRVLGGIVQALQREQHGRPVASQLAVRWGLRVALWVGGLTAFVLVALRPWQAEDVGSWRGAYYPTEELKGRPDVVRVVDIDFAWGKEGPTDSIAADRFSARWDTCLVLDEDAETAFQVISDDGSRIWIDGKVVVDNWEKHRPTAKGKRLPLTAGMHHLRVDYFELKHDASIHLTASFDEDEPPSPIPSRMLEFPGLEIPEDDAANPCEGKR